MVPDKNQLTVDDQCVHCTRVEQLQESDWSACDVVIEASGTLRTAESLQPYLDQDVGRVVVTAPVKDESVLNVVMGVNHDRYRSEQHRIVTAASCTTNSLAPVVKVMQQHLGIERGTITTIHDLTNTQTIIDAHHKDLRRARACGNRLCVYCRQTHLNRRG